MGKATGKDSAAGKATLVGLIGIEEARAQLAAAVVNAERELHQFGDKAGVAHRGGAFRCEPRALTQRAQKPKAPPAGAGDAFDAIAKLARLRSGS